MLNSLGEVALLRQDLDAAADYYQQSLTEDHGPYNAIHAHLGLAELKGKGQKVAVYQILGPRDPTAAAAPAARPGP
jgi:hypothetical protein